MAGLFITGTDTGVGKTYVTSLLTRALRAMGTQTLAIKPFLSGERTDAEVLAAANDETLSLDEINPIWLMPPLSPYAACAVEDKPLDWGKLRGAWEQLRQRHSGPWLVEGVGGWRVPLDATLTVGDWAQELGFPVLIVCRAGLGTINHTLLTVESIRRMNLSIAGVVMNFHNTPDDMASQTNQAILEDLIHLPFLRIEDGQQEIHELPGFILDVLNL